MNKQDSNHEADHKQREKMKKNMSFMASAKYLEENLVISLFCTI